jgi:hypothetical protein
VKHLLWLWCWFFVGALMYWLKRAYYLVTGPNPIANTYAQFWQRCWIPLLVRFFIDSLIFWALFTPGFADKALKYLSTLPGMGFMDNMSWVVMMVTQFAVFAAAFGHTVDSAADFGVSKIPWIKDVLPQMPPPLA